MYLSPRGHTHFRLEFIRAITWTSREYVPRVEAPFGVGAKRRNHCFCGLLVMRRFIER